ncbi:MAG: hypothetical protein NTY51_08960 [Deltaproteobacteria bacterium]|nr:hypothetical protein [Deltaproteobacteria bacterium]
MTTEEKMSNEEKREPEFGFPFGGPQGMKEMMRTWCPPGTRCCNCCSKAKTTKDEQIK